VHPFLFNRLIKSGTDATSPDTSYQKAWSLRFHTISPRFDVRREKCPIRIPGVRTLLQGPMIALNRFGSCWGILLSKLLPYICGENPEKGATGRLSAKSVPPVLWETFLEGLDAEAKKIKGSCVKKNGWGQQW
jgi:hypothetical protein